MEIDWEVLLKIHKDMPRQGSGRDKYTQKAFEMIPKIKNPKILDIGCGPGMQTIKLAKLSGGQVIGIDIFEQFLDQLRESIKKENLQKNVHFLGLKKHEEIPYYMNNSDFGLGRVTHKKMWRYMIPVKCLEYMACKKSFITTPVSQDIIKNNDVGLILKRDFNNKEICNSITTLIEDKNLARKMGEEGYKKINTTFKWETVMQQLNNDIKNLLK